MGIFDGINVSEQAMNVHRMRSEIAAQNIANVSTPGYRRKEVDLRATNFSTALEGARGSNGTAGGGGSADIDATEGAVEIARVRTVALGPDDDRQNAFLATTDMMDAKSAFELASKAATLLKSMALSSLEIGRGS
jgi:flagellar basal-body rod protein FlgB